MFSGASVKKLLVKSEEKKSVLGMIGCKDKNKFPEPYRDGVYV